MITELGDKGLEAYIYRTNEGVKERQLGVIKMRYKNERQDSQVTGTAPPGYTREEIGGSDGHGR